MLPWKINSNFACNCCRLICSREQYKYVMCCRGNSTVISLVIVVGVYVAVNNIKMLCAAMETQQWIPFALLSSYKSFRTAVNNSKHQILFECVPIVALAVRRSNHIFSAPFLIAVCVLSGLCRVQLKCGGTL